MIAKKIVFLFITALVLSAVFFIFSQKNKSLDILNKTVDDIKTENTNKNIQENNKLFVTAWIPYWAKTEGVKSLNNKLDIFSELHPFAFGVDGSGNLTDVLKIKENPWQNLIAQAKEKNIPIVPTILWGDAKAMHNVFSNQELAQKHIGAIAKMLAENNFSGIDIDYEGKDIADKDYFSTFIASLAEKMHGEGKTLGCTIEARTQDNPSEGLTGTRAMSWANDFSVLGKNCDSVTIMAYDQALQIHRANSFDEKDENLSAPNSANDWAQENVEYALRYIPQEKLILGVATYGWEFAWKKIDGGYHYDRIKSISYPSAMQEAASAGVQAQRSVQGELFFTYKASNENRVVTFEDADSLRDKINIAKKYNLKGVSIFKIDGLTDPRIFSVLK